MPQAIESVLQSPNIDLGRVLDHAPSVSDAVDVVDAVDGIADLSDSAPLDGLPDAEDLADKASGGGVLGTMFDLF